MKLWQDDVIEVHGWIMMEGLEPGKYRIKNVSKTHFYPHHDVFDIAKENGNKTIVRHLARSVESWLRKDDDTDNNKITWLYHKSHCGNTAPYNLHPSLRMRSIVVMYDDNDYIETQINGTDEDINHHYVGNSFEKRDETTHKAVKVYFLDKPADVLELIKVRKTWEKDNGNR